MVKRMNQRSSHQTKFFLLAHFPRLQTSGREQRRSIGRGAGGGGISETDFLCRFYPKETSLEGATVVPYFFLNHKHLIWVLYFVPGICPLSFPVRLKIMSSQGSLQLNSVNEKKEGEMSALFSSLAPRNWSGRRPRGVFGPAGLAHADSGCQAALDAEERSVVFILWTMAGHQVAGDLYFLLGPWSENCGSQATCGSVKVTRF